MRDFLASLVKLKMTLKLTKPAEIELIYSTINIHATSPKWLVNQIANV